MLSQLPLGVQDIIHDYLVPFSISIVKDRDDRTYYYTNRFTVIYGDMTFQTTSYFKKLHIKKSDTDILITDKDECRGYTLIRCDLRGYTIVINDIVEIVLANQQMINEFEKFVQHCYTYT